MLRFQDVTKVYSRRGRDVTAFSAAELEIPDGDYVALVGPSGSGKTTMLSMLGGMLSPDTGLVSCDGESLYDLTVAQRAKLRQAKIGFVFQSFNLITYLTAIENVQVPLCLAGLDEDRQVERAWKLLDRIGLGDRIDHKPCELSTGQQQRVALARTLANDPAVILADEPTGNLDPESRARILDFFDELHAEGRTIVMVTHDATAAQRAKRRLHLRDGVVEASPTFSSQAA